MAKATGPSYGRLDSEFGLEVSGAAGPASACTRSMAARCRIILRACRGGPRPAALDAIFEETSSPFADRVFVHAQLGCHDLAGDTVSACKIDDDQIAAVIERTLRSKPDDATHWSICSMGTATGFSHTTIRRIWTAFGLQLHRLETFKLSSDPLFVDKVRDIVGLYLSLANRALVLSVDDKSQIQALDREQPVLPMMPGMPERRTIAMSDTAPPRCRGPRRGVRLVIGKCYKRHQGDRVSGLPQAHRRQRAARSRCSHHHG